MLIPILVFFRSTENSHVKTNMVHTLHRIKATGMQPLESFKELLTPDEFAKCEINPMRGKTWYPLTAEVFVSFLFRVCHSRESVIASFFLPLEAPAQL